MTPEEAIRLMAEMIDHPYIPEIDGDIDADGTLVTDGSPLSDEEA